MLTYFVIVPVLVAVFLYLFPSAKAARMGAIITQVGMVIAAGYLFSISQPYEYMYVAVGNYHGIMGVILRADTLSAAFVLLTTFIFLIASIYSFQENNSRLFWFLLFLWEGALLGLFLTGDFFNIFVLMEVATVVVSVMIMFNRQNRSMYDGMIYLMINVIIIQFYMIGIGYIYRLTGALDLEAVRMALPYLERHNLIVPYALLMTFVALKCALIPLYSWLPKAHGTPGAPSSVSALLSGLYIKAGVYLFLRFQAVFEPIAMFEIFLLMGVITALAGVIMAVSQTDIKLILAYSTIAQVGLIIVGFSISYQYSYNYIGALYHIINHAVFKAALFLAAGVVTYAYGTRNIADIRGVLKKMPLLGWSMVLAILGIIGTPLFNGSISKYFLMTGIDQVLNTLLIIVNLGTIIIMMKFSTIFLGEPKGEVKVKTDIWRHGPIVVLALMCFVGGIFGVQAIEFLFNLEATVDMAGYIEKAGIFLGSLVVGFIIFKYYVQKSVFLSKVKTLEMGFREMCISIGLFMAVIMIWVGVS